MQHRRNKQGKALSGEHGHLINSESVLSVPEEYPTVITEDAPSPKTSNNKKSGVVRESIQSIHSIPDEYSYSELSQRLNDDENPQRSFHSR